jgi:hypothetical protein
MDDSPGKPEKIVAIWVDTVLNRTGEPPVRGFGGRLMFYEAGKPDPVKIDGKLVVYAFDETGRDASSARPDRKYIFTPEQVQVRYSKSKIGHSYSVWIPWDQVGGVQKEISLIARFEPKGAPAVVGEQSRLLLPGIQPAERPALAASLPAAASTGSVQQTSYNAALPGDCPNFRGHQSAAMVDENGTVPFAGSAGNQPSPNDDRPRRMTTTTIDIPSEMAARQALEPGPAMAPVGNWQPQAPWRPNPQEASRLQPSYPTTAQPAPPAWPGWTPPQAGFPPGPPRNLNAIPALLGRDRAPWQQCPARLPSVLEAQPGQEATNGWKGDSSSAVRLPN